MPIGLDEFLANKPIQKSSPVGLDEFLSEKQQATQEPIGLDDFLLSEAQTQATASPTRSDLENANYGRRYNALPEIAAGIAKNIPTGPAEDALKRIFNPQTYMGLTDKTAGQVAPVVGDAIRETFDPRTLPNDSATIEPQIATGLQQARIPSVPSPESIAKIIRPIDKNIRAAQEGIGKATPLGAMSDSVVSRSIPNPGLDRASVAVAKSIPAAVEAIGRINPDLNKVGKAQAMLERQAYIEAKSVVDDPTRYIKSLGSGGAQSVASLGQTVQRIGLETPGTVLENIGTQVANKLAVENPTLLDKVASGVGSSGPLMLPGLGSAGLLAKLGTSARLADVLGMSLSTVLESAMEAGAVRQTAIQNGKSLEDANLAHDAVFFGNMVLLSGSNPLEGIFNSKLPALSHVVSAALVNPGQEVGQQIMSNVVTDRPISEGVSESALLSLPVGAIQGGGAALLNRMTRGKAETPPQASPAPSAPIQAGTPTQPLPSLSASELKSNISILQNAADSASNDPSWINTPEGKTVNDLLQKNLADLKATEQTPQEQPKQTVPEITKPHQVVAMDADSGLPIVKMGTPETVPSTPPEQTILEPVKPPERIQTPEIVSIPQGDVNKPVPQKEPWEMKQMDYIANRPRELMGKMAELAREKITELENRMGRIGIRKGAANDRRDIQKQIDHYRRNLNLVETAKTPQGYAIAHDSTFSTPFVDEIEDIGTRNLYRYQPEYLKSEHEEAIRQALASGLPVPPEVLADYPDLTPAPAATETAGTTQKMTAGEVQPTAGAGQIKKPRSAKVFNKGKQGTSEMPDSVSSGIPKIAPIIARKYGKAKELLTFIPNEYYSDGAMIVKGTPPKTATYSKRIDNGKDWKKEISNLLSDTKDLTKASFVKFMKVERFTSTSIDLKTNTTYKPFYSEAPIDVPEKQPYMDNKGAFAILKSGDKYITYEQSRFVHIISKYPNATIQTKDNGMALFKVGNDTVAALMPINLVERHSNERVHEFKDLQELESTVTVGKQAKPEGDRFKFRTETPRMYSKLQRVIEQKMPNVADVAMVRNIIKEAKSEELKWSGIESFLQGKSKVSKQELMDYLKGNEVQVQEVQKKNEERNYTIDDIEYKGIEKRGSENGGVGFHIIKVPGNELMFPVSRYPTRTDAIERALQKTTGYNTTKFSKYSIPGGENYRELLFTLPQKKTGMTYDEAILLMNDRKKYPVGSKQRDELKKYLEIAPDTEHNPLFQSSHWDEPNVIAHARVNDRTTPDGKKILFIEEIQSDWARVGRERGFKSGGLDSIEQKRYDELHTYWANSMPMTSKDLVEHDSLRKKLLAETEGVASAPFLKNWQEFTLKKLLMKATEEGYDGVAWINGEQTAERYDLSKKISEVMYNETRSALHAYDLKGEPIIVESNVPKEKLQEYVGKDVAERLLNKEPDKITTRGAEGQIIRRVSGLDLKVGGEWAKTLYDKQIPNIMGDLGKSFGAKVSMTDTGIKELPKAMYLPITSQMRQGMELPLFRKDAEARGAISEKQKSEIKNLNRQFFGDDRYDFIDQISKDGAIGLYDAQEDIISILEGRANALDTFKHESVHRYVRKFLSAEERKILLDRYGDEEVIAENFIKYSKSRTGLIGRIKAIFDALIVRIKAFLKMDVDAVKAMYDDILSGKGARITRERIAKARNKQKWNERDRQAINKSLGIVKDAPAMYRDQTKTPEFKAWFGDSKVVDENGKPLVVYHGYKGETFNTFKPGTDGAMYFTNKKNIAEGYARGAFLFTSKNKEPMTHDSYLKMVNPLVIDADGTRNDNIPVPWSAWKPKVFGRIPDTAVSVSDAAIYAKEHGYDGLIVKNVVDTIFTDEKDKSDVYAVFDPTQIKSATGNIGTFDPKNPDIRYRTEEDALIAEARKYKTVEEFVNYMDSAGITKDNNLYFTGSNSPKISGKIKSIGGGLWFTKDRDIADWYAATRSGKSAVDDLGHAGHLLIGDLSNKKIANSDIDYRILAKDLAVKQHAYPKEHQFDDLMGDSIQQTENNIFEHLKNIELDSYGGIFDIENNIFSGKNLLKKYGFDGFKDTSGNVVVYNNKNLQLKNLPQIPKKYTDQGNLKELPENFIIHEKQKTDYMGNPLFHKKIPVMEYAVFKGNNQITHYSTSKNNIVENVLNDINRKKKISKISQLTDIWRKAHEGDVKYRTEEQARQTEAQDAYAEFQQEEALDRMTQWPERVAKPDPKSEMVADVSQLKDISGFSGQFRDLNRNIDHVFGKGTEQAKAIDNELIRPFEISKSKFVDMQKELTDELYSKVVNKYNFKKGSKESAAIQDFGEKRRDQVSLVKQFGRKVSEQIIEADKFFRAQYDKLIDTINASRKAIYGDMWAKKRAIDEEIDILSKSVANNVSKMNAKKRTDTLVFAKLKRRNERLRAALDKRIELMNSDEWWRGKMIPKRADYYRHFFELSDGLDGLINAFETASGINPKLVGISEHTKPKAKFLGLAQKRTGDETEHDAIGGFLNYIPAAAYATHIDPNIFKFRQLASELAEKTKDTKTLNNFIEYLNDFANDLAGKTNPADRYIQKVIPGGRTAMRVVNWLNRRVKANTILGNASSALAQIFNVPQSIGSAKIHSVRGATRTIAQVFSKNEPMSRSIFIKERYSGKMYNRFDVGIMQNAQKFAAWMVGALDEVGTRFAWNAHYEKAIAEKISDPIRYADDMTRKLVAGRGVGEVPLGQKSKAFQLVAPFQLEVANTWHVLKDFIDEKDFAAIALMLITSFMMNEVAKEIRGSDVVFDPINAAFDGYKAFNEEKNPMIGSLRFAGRMAGEVASNLPLAQTIAAGIPEKGVFGVSKQKLFGAGDPTRFGGGLLAVKGIFDPLFKILPPFGGGQIKKAWQGISVLNDNGIVRRKDGKRVFNIDKSNPAEVSRSVLFGPWQTKAGREYLEKRGMR